MRPNDFFDRFTDAMWFDPNAHPKTTRARLALCHLPPKLREELPHIVIGSPFL
jgi:hypothetical protein